jgi:hypothetical protein
LNALLHLLQQAAKLIIEIDKVHYSKEPFEHVPNAAARKPA